MPRGRKKRLQKQNGDMNKIYVKMPNGDVAPIIYQVDETEQKTFFNLKQMLETYMKNSALKWTNYTLYIYEANKSRDKSRSDYVILQPFHEIDSSSEIIVKMYDIDDISRKAETSNDMTKPEDKQDPMGSIFNSELKPISISPGETMSEKNLLLHLAGAPLIYQMETYPKTQKTVEVLDPVSLGLIGYLTPLDGNRFIMAKSVPAPAESLTFLATSTPVKADNEFNATVTSKKQETTKKRSSSEGSSSTKNKSDDSLTSDKDVLKQPSEKSGKHKTVRNSAYYEKKNKPKFTDIKDIPVPVIPKSMRNKLACNGLKNADIKRRLIGLLLTQFEENMGNHRYNNTDHSLYINAVFSKYKKTFMKAYGLDKQHSREELSRLFTTAKNNRKNKSQRKQTPILNLCPIQVDWKITENCFGCIRAMTAINNFNANLLKKQRELFVEESQGPIFSGKNTKSTTANTTYKSNMLNADDDDLVAESGGNSDIVPNPNQKDVNTSVSQESLSPEFVTKNVRSKESESEHSKKEQETEELRMKIASLKIELKNMKMMTTNVTPIKTGFRGNPVVSTPSNSSLNRSYIKRDARNNAASTLKQDTCNKSFEAVKEWVQATSPRIFNSKIQPSLLAPSADNKVKKRLKLSEATEQVRKKAKPLEIKNAISSEDEVEIVDGSPNKIEYNLKRAKGIPRPETSISSKITYVPKGASESKKRAMAISSNSSTSSSVRSIVKNYADKKKKKVRKVTMKETTVGVNKINVGSTNDNRNALKAVIYNTSDEMSSASDGEVNSIDSSNGDASAVSSNVSFDVSVSATEKFETIESKKPHDILMWQYFENLSIVDQKAMVADCLDLIKLYETLPELFDYEIINKLFLKFNKNHTVSYSIGIHEKIVKKFLSVNKILNPDDFIGTYKECEMYFLLAKKLDAKNGKKNDADFEVVQFVHDSKINTNDTIIKNFPVFYIYYNDECKITSVKMYAGKIELSIPVPDITPYNTISFVYKTYHVLRVKYCRSMEMVATVLELTLGGMKAKDLDCQPNTEFTSFCKSLYNIDTKSYSSVKKAELGNRFEVTPVENKRKNRK